MHTLLIAHSSISTNSQCGTILFFSWLLSYPLPPPPSSHPHWPTVFHDPHVQTMRHYRHHVTSRLTYPAYHRNWIDVRSMMTSRRWRKMNLSTSEIHSGRMGSVCRHCINKDPQFNTDTHTRYMAVTANLPHHSLLLTACSIHTLYTLFMHKLIIISHF